MWLIIEAKRPKKEYGGRLKLSEDDVHELSRDMFPEQYDDEGNWLGKNA